MLPRGTAGQKSEKKTNAPVSEDYTRVSAPPSATPPPRCFEHVPQKPTQKFMYTGLLREITNTPFLFTIEVPGGGGWDGGTASPETTASTPSRASQNVHSTSDNTKEKICNCTPNLYKNHVRFRDDGLRETNLHTPFSLSSPHSEMNIQKQKPTLLIFSSRTKRNCSRHALQSNKKKTGSFKSWLRFNPVPIQSTQYWTARVMGKEINKKTKQPGGGRF